MFRSSNLNIDNIIDVFKDVQTGTCIKLDNKVEKRPI